LNSLPYVEKLVHLFACLLLGSIIAPLAAIAEATILQKTACGKAQRGLFVKLKELMPAAKNAWA
jgi:hypothetical protein